MVTRVLKCCNREKICTIFFEVSMRRDKEEEEEHEKERGQVELEHVAQSIKQGKNIDLSARNSACHRTKARNEYTTNDSHECV